MTRTYSTYCESCQRIKIMEVFALRTHPYSQTESESKTMRILLHMVHILNLGYQSRLPCTYHYTRTDTSVSIFKKYPLFVKNRVLSSSLPDVEQPEFSNRLNRNLHYPNLPISQSLFDNYRISVSPNSNLN